MPVLTGVVASAHVDEDDLPTYMVEDDWTGTNGDPWDADVWFDAAAKVANLTVQSNAGQISGGTSFIVSQMSATDFELLVKVSYATLTGIGPEICWRMSNGLASGPDKGYLIQLTPSGGGEVDMYDATGYAGLDSVADSALGGSNMVWWFRINVVGTAHKVRWWEDGDAEPGTWQMNVTNSSYGGGRFMLRNYGSGAVSFDDLDIVDLSAIVVPKAAKWPDTPAGYAVAATGFAGSDMTICGWFRRDNNAAGSNWFGVDDNGSNYWIISSEGGSDNLVFVAPSGGFTTGYTFTQGVWHHIAVVSVDATGVHTIRVTPAGGSTSTYTSGAATKPGNYTLALGKVYGNTNEAQVANFKVWTAALTGGKVATEAAHYEAQRTSNLWGEYSFYEGSTTMQLADLSGNGRHMDHRDASRMSPYTVAGPAGIVV